MSEDLLTSLTAAAQVLVGEQLSSITFVQDYWQLAFDGSGFTVYSSITVTGPGWQVRDGDDEFRNRICERIARLVTQVTARPDGVMLTFDDGCRVELSLQRDDCHGPEALTFQAFGESLLYVV